VCLLLHIWSSVGCAFLVVIVNLFYLSRVVWAALCCVDCWVCWCVSSLLVLTWCFRVCFACCLCLIMIFCFVVWFFIFSIVGYGVRGANCPADVFVEVYILRYCDLVGAFWGDPVCFWLWVVPKKYAFLCSIFWLLLVLWCVDCIVSAAKYSHVTNIWFFSGEYWYGNTAHNRCVRATVWGSHPYYCQNHNCKLSQFNDTRRRSPISGQSNCINTQYKPHHLITTMFWCPDPPANGSTA